MPSKILWVEYDNGFLGILECGIATINIFRMGKEWGPRTGMFLVQFANRTASEFYWDPEKAKVAGVLLARQALAECLVNLESLESLETSP